MIESFSELIIPSSVLGMIMVCLTAIAVFCFIQNIVSKLLSATTFFLGCFVTIAFFVIKGFVF